MEWTCVRHLRRKVCGLSHRWSVCNGCAWARFSNRILPRSTTHGRRDAPAAWQPPSTRDGALYGARPRDILGFAADFESRRQSATSECLLESEGNDQFNVGDADSA